MNIVVLSKDPKTKQAAQAEIERYISLLPAGVQDFCESIEFVAIGPEYRGAASTIPPQAEPLRLVILTSTWFAATATDRKFVLYHEIAHVQMHKYGIPRLFDDEPFAEKMADSTALFWLSLQKKGAA